MDLSSLPAYPKPETPASTLAHSSSHGKKMFFQVLVVLAFWSAVYILREQVTWIVAAEKQARERAEAEALAKYPLEGKWRSTAKYETVLQFSDGKFTLICDHWTIVFAGEYKEDKAGEVLALRGFRSIKPTTHKYRVRARSLEIWDLPEQYRHCGIASTPESCWNFERER